VQTSRSQALLLFLAISLHKVFSAMSISTRFLRRGCSPLLLFLLLLPYHLLPPLSILLAAIVGAENDIASLILSGLATGTFIYIGAFEVVSEEFADCQTAEGADASGHDMVDDGASDEGAGAVAHKVQRKSWRPSKAAKFGAFALGSLVLLGLVAVVPEGAHHH
jgi:hypothetical protein